MDSSLCLAVGLIGFAFCVARFAFKRGGNNEGASRQAKLRTLQGFELTEVLKDEVCLPILTVKTAPYRYSQFSGILLLSRNTDNGCISLHWARVAWLGLVS